MAATGGLVPGLKLCARRLAVAAWAAAGLSAPAQAADLSARDVVLLPEIVRLDGGPPLLPSGLHVANDPRVFAYSPDRKLVIVRERRADLASDENVDELLVWSLADLARATRLGGAPPRPRIVARARSHDDWAAMSGIRWIGNRRVAFIARGRNGHAQAFVSDVSSGRTRQLTASTTDVVSFDMSGGTILYYARRPPRRTTSVTPVTGIGAAFALTDPDPTGQPLELHALGLNGRRSVRISAPAVHLEGWNRGIWLSPDGRTALTLTPATDAPRGWSRYRVWDNESRGWTPNWVIHDPTSRDLYDRLRYQVVDLDTRTVHPLFDAPDGSLTFSPTPHQIFWIDNRHAVVTHTYLPLNSGDPTEDRRRADNPAIAEVDVLTGRATAIAWEPFPTAQEQRSGQSRPTIVSVDWDGHRHELGITTKMPTQSLQSTSYKLSEGAGWQSVSDRASRDDDASAVELKLVEGPQHPPTIDVCSQPEHCPTVLYDPLGALRPRPGFGQERPFEWVDADGRRWRGTLILPPYYGPGHRYPFVLQTHGFARSQFVIGGPPGATTTFAAQPLASAGFVVLQAGEAGQAVSGNPQEGANVAEGWSAAIDELDRQGIIDRSRIGLIGWSRTGYYVARFLGLRPNAIGAAIISDSVQFDYSQYLLSASGSRFSGSEFDHLVGPLQPSRAGIARWIDADAFYDLLKSNAALRIETIGPGSLVSMWETYALYRAAARPAEVTYYPSGSHALAKPSERLASLQGTVDWFDFWLNGREDADPAKADQYARWRKLRAERDAEQPPAIKASTP